jgi:phage FluMu protein gp41
MRQAIAAGDDTPQASQPPQTQPDPQGPLATVVVRARTPKEFLPVVPHLVGFTPESSLVVIGLAPPRDRVRVTLRYDLPEPPDEDVIADLVAHAVGVLGSQRLAAAIAVAYGPEGLVIPVAGALLDAAHQAGIELYDILRVEGGRYWSYACSDEACCQAAGVPFDATAPPAVAAALAGPGGARSPVLAGRAAVTARVAPIGGIAAESMRQATRRAEQHVARLLAKVRKSGRIGAARRMIAAEGLAAVGQMITSYRGGGRFTSDYELARIAVALRDLRVRDDAWARMDPAHAEAHLRLWIDVVRRAQPGYAAAPAALLAFVAWQSGDGTLANVALDRALADDATYSMAMLLRQVISAGAPPSLARLPMTPEEVAASYDHAEEDDAEEDDAEHRAFGDDDDDADHDLDINDHHSDLDGED